MARRILAALAVAALVSVGLVVASAAPASAKACPSTQPHYPGDNCGILLSRYAGDPGTIVRARAQYFKPGCVVKFTMKKDSQTPYNLGTTVAGPQGRARKTFTVPAGATPGGYTVSATQQVTANCQLVSYTVGFLVRAHPNASSNTGPLSFVPTSKEAAIPTAGAGALAVLGGLWLILLGRRRRVGTSKG